MKNLTENIRIVNGLKHIHNDNDVETFSYTFLDFSNVETTNADWRELSKEQIAEMMNQKSSLIFFERIKNLGAVLDPSATGMPTVNGFGKIDYSRAITGNQSRYNNYPSGFLSSNGTIMPIPIVPQKDYYEAKNTNWVGYQISRDNGDGIRRVIEVPRTAEYFGQRTDENYISNASCRTKYDNPVYCTRDYAYQYNQEFHEGAFIFCYNSINRNELGEGKSLKEKSESPYISCTMKPHFVDPKNFTNDNWIYKHYIDEVLAKNADSLLTMKISLNDSVQVYYKSRTLNGGMEGLIQDNIPELCYKSSTELQNYPIFIYPTYHGLVFSNSVSPNVQKKNEMTLNVFSPQTMKNSVQIRGVTKSDYISNAMSANKSQLEWFPALFAESKSRGDIRLRLPSNNLMRFGNTFITSWIKSVGNFAYIPLFFCRILKFSLFFKGAYSKDASIGGTYYIYPIVSQSTAFGNGADWSGVGENGAEAIVISASRENAFYIDDSAEEAIYKADFYFSTGALQRFPIEVHGAIIAYVKNGFNFSIENGDGNPMSQNIKGNYLDKIPKLNDYLNTPLFDLMTSLSVESSLEGVVGNVSIDGYPIKDELSKIIRSQKVGHLELDVETDNENTSNPHPSIFKGYGLEIGTSNSGNSNEIQLTIAGIQKKMDGMKLVCAPLWDGDKLEFVSAYFEKYLNLDIRMIDHTVNSFDDAKAIDYTSLHSTTSHYWRSNGKLISGISTPNVAFRLPRSANWQNPAVNFENGRSCLEALNELSTYCGCVFVPESNGIAYFYELNDYGFPYVVHNEMSNCVEFKPEEIISISVSPFLENKFNAVATFGLLVKKTSRGEIELMQNDFLPGLLYDKISSDSVFPWTKPSVGAERGRLTKTELKMLHKNRIRFAKIDRYSGNLTVQGNTKIYHMYQPLQIVGNYFFVNSISHSINLMTKEWTTSYNLQYLDTDSLSGNW